MSHYIKKCKICKKVISQCRCMSCNKTEIFDICNECKKIEDIKTGTGNDRKSV